MPSNIKVTWFFEANVRGWTESLYLLTENNDLAFAVGLGERLAEDRVSLLGAQGRIKAIRASNDDVLNDSFLKYVDLVSDANQDCADLDIALLARCTNFGNTAFKNTFLRGFWDSIEVEGGLFRGPQKAAFQKLFNVWARRLKTGNWQWKRQSVSNAVKHQITGYVVDVNKQVRITVREPFAPPDVIGSTRMARISGVNGHSVLNGSHLVELVDANTALTKLPIAVFPYVYGGVLKLTGKTFVPIEDAAAQKIVPRKSGAPLLATVGRRPARGRG